MAPAKKSAGTPATPDPADVPVVEDENLEDPALDENGNELDPETGEPVVAPAPVDPGPQGTPTSATPSVDNPAAQPNAAPAPVVDHQANYDQLLEIVTDFQRRLSAIEDRFSLLETEHLQEQQAAARQADSTSETSEYRCLECNTTIRAIHPSKWWPAYGPIECPNHPGRPELMVNLEIAAQAANVEAPATQTAVAPGRQPITVVPGTAADQSTTGTVGDVPPPPPSATTLPPTIVSGPPSAYDGTNSGANLGEGTAGNELAGSTVEPAPGADNPVPQSEQAPLPAPAL